MAEWEPWLRDGLKSIAANIRRLRLRKGWTQEQLAEAAEIENRYVQTLESGAANPSAVVLMKVARALETKPGSLFRAADLPPRREGRPSAKMPRKGGTGPRRAARSRPVSE